VGSTSSGVVGYYVYRSTTSGSGYTKLNAGSVAPTTTYTDSTVKSGMTYYYVVTAVDGSGTESSYSNQASAAIPTP
jgi:fibronectin type 3 domain-containing protein